MPTNTGATMAPMAIEPYAAPIWTPSNSSVVPRKVPSVTNQAPQMKYWRNIIAPSRTRTLTGAP